MQTPSFLETYISQIPALKLLMQLGWEYLSPVEALELRGKKSSNTLLDSVLRTQLKKLNKINYKGIEHEFSESNIEAAINELKNLPLHNGFIASNKHFYELITSGKSFEQQISGDKKSFSLRYIDWKNPTNNVFHVSDEFSVMRTDRTDHFRPDIVLFINGIPTVIIECKSPKEKTPIDAAIEQHTRNQQLDGILNLYQYSNILISLSVNEAKYATTATSKKFWSIWREVFYAKQDEIEYNSTVNQLKNSSLEKQLSDKLFKNRPKNVLNYFQNLEKEEQIVTEQDKLLYNLCQKDRLLDLIFNFIVFENSVKKIARYQQYFSVKQTSKKILNFNSEGQRKGGVIWHTQGSGKSLTMVMLAQAIIQNPAILNPKIILVTDRIELDKQITDTFKKCGIEPQNANVGASKEIIKKLSGENLSETENKKLQKDKSLVNLLVSNQAEVITTIINKFEAAVKAQLTANNSSEITENPNVFVLIDEGHRSQYGSFNVKMRQVFQKSCFIAFTGTPLMKKEKSTAQKFGGIIDVYSITNAVADKSVVPLLYEGRYNLLSVNEKPLDNYFDRVSEKLSEYGKTSLKRKFSSLKQINQADQVIYARAWDISDYFEKNWKNTGFKAQLVAPNKLSAIIFKNYLDEIGKVSSEVVISPPDIREGEDSVFIKKDDKIKKFWIEMMFRYGNPKNYEETIINAFKNQENPQIIIVVDKLLTGFDEPKNTIMFLTRQMREHSLLQAIARVNRVCEGKDYGYIIDYFGNLENLDYALETYSGLENFDEDDLKDLFTNINKEIEKLPQIHSELWDIFKEVKNKYDTAAYEELLSDEAKRHLFYEKLSYYARLLKMALSSLDFCNKTPEKQISKYKKDAKFFLQLRVSVKRRYFDDLDFREYEPQIQKLIDTYITTEGEILKITDLVDVFDKKQRDTELEKITGKAAKADFIAHKTLKAINLKMNEDPVYYKKLAMLIKETIEAYHQHRISELEYYQKNINFEKDFNNPKRDDVPKIISENPVAIAFYGLSNNIFEDNLKNINKKDEISAEIAQEIDNCIRSIVFENQKLIVDWQLNSNIDGSLRILIDEVLYDIGQNQELNFDLNKIDEFVEECLKIARIKYV